MTKPNNFIMNSDYASLKNDATGTISITIPSGNIAGGATRRTANTLTIGTIGASLRGYMVQSNSPTEYCVGTSMGFPISVTQLGYTYDLDINVNTRYVSEGVIELYCNIINFAPSNVLTVNESITVTAYISTFLSPFN